MKRWLSMRYLPALLLAFLLLAIPTKAADSFTGGSGTSSDPYIIATTEDFLKVGSHLNSSFLQVADISLEGETLTPIGSEAAPFRGTYNGSGFKISGAEITAGVSDDSNTYIGLFGYLTGTLSNIVLEDTVVKLHSTTHTVHGGALAGYSNDGKITGCWADADVTLSTKGDRLYCYAGGICGSSYSIYDIAACNFSGTLSASVSYVNSIVYAGGITAFGRPVNCRNDGTVSVTGFATSKAWVGGIVGEGYGEHKNCLNTGTVSVSGAEMARVGGIAGYAIDCTGCKNTGEVYSTSSDSQIGGIAGQLAGDITFCENRGYIHGSSSSASFYAGGITSVGSISNCKNYGTVSGSSATSEARIGGIVGTGGAKRCVNYGSVSSLGNGRYSLSGAGGIVGIAQYGTVLQCGNYGSISGIGNDNMLDCFVGGIIGGSSDATVIDCFNAGSISHDYQGTRNYDAGAAGGVYGESDGTTCITCYNVGPVSVSSSYSTIGGIQGLGNSMAPDTLTSCYALEAYDDPSAIEMTLSQSKLQATYEGFDFDSIWAMDPAVNDGWPYLKTLPSDDHGQWYTPRPVSTAATRVWISSKSLNMGVGDYETLTAIVLPAYAADRTVNWRSSDPAVVSVAQDGTITAVAPGTATITAETKTGRPYTTCTVTVVPRGADEYWFGNITPTPDGLFSVTVTNVKAQGAVTVLLIAYDADGQYLGMTTTCLRDLEQNRTARLPLSLDHISGTIGHLTAIPIPSFSHPIPLGYSRTLDLS